MAWTAALYLLLPPELLAKLPNDSPREYRMIEGRAGLRERGHRRTAGG